MTKQGFTLVEIALSILVISVGLMAIFSLFPSGMAMNKEAIDNTQGAMFADEVLNGVKAQATVTPWNNLRTMIIEPRAPDMWEFASQARVEANQGWRTAVYRPAGLDGAIDFGMRYNLVVDYFPGDQRDHRAFVLLEVVPGEFGPTNRVLRFYTELFNSRPAS